MIYNKDGDNMEDKILEILKDAKKALSVHELEEALGYRSVDKLKELLKQLNAMEDELKIYRTNKDNYMLFNNSHLKLGKMLATKKGYGFVDIEGDDDIFIPACNMNNAIHGDKVVVEITNPLTHEGRIVKIVSRDLDLMVGELDKRDNQNVVILDEEKVHINVTIDDAKLNGAMPGHKVLIKVCEQGKNNNKPYHLTRSINY